MLSAVSVLVSKNKSDDSFLAGRNHGANTGQPVLDPIIKMITHACMLVIVRCTRRRRCVDGTRSINL